MKSADTFASSTDDDSLNSYGNQPTRPVAASACRLGEIALQASTGIDRTTGLASDFLNQFNEVSMLLDMAADDVEMLEELSDWTPRGYVEHFEASNFRDSQLVLEAYALSPTATRVEFDRLSHELGNVIYNGLKVLRPLIDGSPEIAPRSQTLAAEVRQRIDVLSSIIHPTEKSPADAEISAMFAARR